MRDERHGLAGLGALVAVAGLLPFTLGARGGCEGTVRIGSDGEEGLVVPRPLDDLLGATVERYDGLVEGACTPAEGYGLTQGGIGDVHVAVLERPGEAAVVRLTGVATFDGVAFADAVCADLSRIELTDGGRVLQEIEVEPAPRLYETRVVGEMARLELDVAVEGEASAELLDLCAAEGPRALPFQIRAVGPVDGGTLEGLNEHDVSGCGGFWGWPPAVVLTCHQGLEEAPDHSEAEVWEPTLPFDTLYTTVNTYYPEGVEPPGVARVDEVFVTPLSGLHPHGGLMETFSTTGWAVSFSDGTFSGDLALENTTDVLGDACPAWDEDDITSEVYGLLLRVTGIADGEPFSTELFVPECWRFVD